MSDEIDIEEHDILNNPTIRRIFPDISIIKKEIIQFEEGVDTNNDTPQKIVADSVLDPEPTITHQIDSEVCAQTSCKPIQPKTKDTQLDVHIRFKKFLESLSDDVFDSDCNSEARSDVCTDTISSSPKSSRRIQIQNKKCKPSKNNIFILGSKPNLQKPIKTRIEKKQLKIVLKNLTPYLNGSKKYCKHCFILFPSVDAFRCHFNKTHSVNTNSYNAKKKKANNMNFECEICLTQVSSKGNLVRHFKRFHDFNKPSSTEFVNRETKKSLRSSTQVIKSCSKVIQDTKDKQNAKGNNCFHCHKSFDNQSSLIEHLYAIINPNKANFNNLVKPKQIINSPNKKINTTKNMDNSAASKSIECKRTCNPISNIDLNSTNKLNNNSKTNNTPTTLNEINTPKESMYLDEDESGSLNFNSKIHPKDKSKLTEKDNQNSKQKHESLPASAVNAIQEHKKLYQCYVCSKYLFYLRPYSRHMHNHNIKGVVTGDKTVYDGKCKFCPVRVTTIKSYNWHIAKLHQNKFKKKIKLNENAFQSVLFKCFKCNVFFLSANAAKNHSEHKQIFLNWKCSDCQRLFKVKEKALHLQQHAQSKNLTAYALSESALNRVLCKCLKCGVHFSEREYFLHSTKCDFEIPNSTYCNACDILVNRKDMDLHEKSHKDKKLKLFDFTFIESDILNSVDKQATYETKNTRSKYELTFCHVCNCFLGNMGMKRKAHIEKRCGKINPRMCRKCGLVFTSKGYLAHDALHDKVKNLNMQAFQFYDIETKKQIVPPIPKFPNCNICEVHFFNKAAFRQHECSQQNFKMCHICKIKLTEAAFKLHNYYHIYKLKSSGLGKKQSTRYKLKASPSSTPTVVSVNKKRERIVVLENHSINQPTNTKETPLLYTCIICQITFEAYDKVVQHCQDHYDYKENLSNYDYANSPSNTKRDELTKPIKFDPFYFRFNKDVWFQHIFENFTEIQIKNIVTNSIYKYECRIKMEEIQTGTPALYKCDICRSYIEPSELYSHAASLCTASKKHICSRCGLSFYTESYRTIHEKIHIERPTTNIQSYRIIMFNKTEHRQITEIMIDSLNRFVFYQCRNCEGIVDRLQRDVHQCHNSELKSCSYCKLLFCDQEINSHMAKHKAITHFQPENMIVILFGKLKNQKSITLNSSFSGKVYDLTFYKCTDCGLCLLSKTDTYDHTCVSKTIKPQCPKCYLCFTKKHLQDHFQLHDSCLELGYDDFNSNVITFSNDNTKGNPQDLLNENENEIEEHNNIPKIINENNDAVLTQTLYKCICGLHFLEQPNATRHYVSCNPRMKMSKQNCFKCDLLFTPGELFNHLIKNHRKVNYKYDIINVGEGDKNVSNTEI